jgi:hypothetical protein
MSAFVGIYLIYLDFYYLRVDDDSFAPRKTFLTSHWLVQCGSGPQKKMTYDQLLG